MIMINLNRIIITATMYFNYRKSHSLLELQFFIGARGEVFFTKSDVIHYNEKRKWTNLKKIIIIKIKNNSINKLPNSSKKSSNHFFMFMPLKYIGLIHIYRVKNFYISLINYGLYQPF